MALILNNIKAEFIDNNNFTVNGVKVTFYNGVVTVKNLKARVVDPGHGIKCLMEEELVPPGPGTWYHIFKAYKRLERESARQINDENN